ncbi:MAG: hypothetical protein QW423_00030 [Candidatus Aenigmatarchaeota archaeon]
MKIFFLITILAFFLLTHLTKSFTVSCEAGGPYATSSTVLIVGNVTGEVSNITNITVNITKYSSPKASQATTSDSSGTYFSIFTQSFDIGTYDVNVVANNSTHTASCNDTFDVIPSQVSKECQQKTIYIEGNSYHIAGNLVSSGKIFVSIEDSRSTNITTFSNGFFKAYLTACLNFGKKYILQVSITDDEGKKGTIFIPFTPT